MPNSMDFHNGTFLHVIPVLVVVPFLKYSFLSTVLHPVRLLPLLLKGQGCSSISRIVSTLKISHDDGITNRAKLEHALHYFSVTKKDL